MPIIDYLDGVNDLKGVVPAYEVKLGSEVRKKAWLDSPIHCENMVASPRLAGGQVLSLVELQCIKYGLGGSGQRLASIGADAIEMRWS